MFDTSPAFPPPPFLSKADVRLLPLRPVRSTRRDHPARIHRSRHATFSSETRCSSSSASAARAGLASAKCPF